MTYKELYEKAAAMLDRGEITLGDFNKMVKPLDVEIQPEPHWIPVQAAYEHGKEWLSALKQHLVANREFVRSFLKNNLPKVRLIEPEGTYLLWLDFSAYGYTDSELDDIIVNKAKLWLDRGTMFGKEGEFYQRINIATPQPLLKEALERLQRVL